MDTLASNFFHEFICRLIPGIIVIGFYGKNYVKVAYKEFEKFAGSLGFCVLLVAWLIGATLDTVTFSPVHAWFPNFLSNVNPLPQKDVVNLEAKTNNVESDAEKFDRIQKIRLESEVSLFRIMFVIFAITLVFKPKDFPGGFLKSRVISLVCIGIFFICWYYARIGLN